MLVPAIIKTIPAMTIANTQANVVLKKSFIIYYLIKLI
jgi:hypothetical protein